jgi:CheY-like chemotaxis protein
MAEDPLEGLSEPSRLAVRPSSINILVVDDHQANRVAFQTLLDQLGYAVFLASSGNEALALATRVRFAVILLDVRMPVMDGLETALFLRKKPFNRNAPIIFVSAHYGTAEQVSQISLGGLIGYVHSPVDSELLVWKVKSYVEHYLKNEELRRWTTLVLQAYEEHFKFLEADPKAGTDLRRSGERLGEALEGLKDTLSGRQGVRSS